MEFLIIAILVGCILGGALVDVTDAAEERCREKFN